MHRGRNLAPVDTPGRETQALVSLTTTGAIPAGGTVSVAMPAAKGWVVRVPEPTVLPQPPLDGALFAAATWSSAANVLTLNLSAPVAASTELNFTVYNVTTPSSVKAAAAALTRTRLSTGGLIDGPTEVIVNAVTAGVLTGAKTFDSAVTTPPGVESPVTVTFTATGAIPEGGQLRNAWRNLLHEIERPGRSHRECTE